MKRSQKLNDLFRANFFPHGMFLFTVFPLPSPYIGFCPGKTGKGKTIILLLLYLRPNALLKEKMLVLQKRGVDLSSLTCKCWSWLDSNSFTRSFFLAQNDFSYHQRILIPLLLFLLKRWFYWIASL